MPSEERFVNFLKSVVKFYDSTNAKISWRTAYTNVLNTYYPHILQDAAEKNIVPKSDANDEELQEFLTFVRYEINKYEINRK